MMFPQGLNNTPKKEVKTLVWKQLAHLYRAHNAILVKSIYSDSRKFLISGGYCIATFSVILSSFMSGQVLHFFFTLDTDWNMQTLYVEGHG